VNPWALTGYAGNWYVLINPWPAGGAPVVGLPSFKDWRSRAGPLPWEGVKDGGAWCWQFDGREFRRFPEHRGRLEPKGDVPEPLRKLCAFFKGRTEFEVVQVFAFPVADEQK
jgi:hypothetical protein